jgi:hypothetical protein
MPDAALPVAVELKGVVHARLGIGATRPVLSNHLRDYVVMTVPTPRLCVCLGAESGGDAELHAFDYSAKAGPSVVVRIEVPIGANSRGDVLRNLVREVLRVAAHGLTAAKSIPNPQHSHRLPGWCQKKPSISMQNPGRVVGLGIAGRVSLLMAAPM